MKSFLSIAILVFSFGAKAQMVSEVNPYEHLKETSFLFFKTYRPVGKYLFSGSGPEIRRDIQNKIDCGKSTVFTVEAPVKTSGSSGPSPARFYKAIFYFSNGRTLEINEFSGDRLWARGKSEHGAAFRFASLLVNPQGTCLEEVRFEVTGSARSRYDIYAE